MGTFQTSAQRVAPRERAEVLLGEETRDWHLRQLGQLEWMGQVIGELEEAQNRRTRICVGLLLSLWLGTKLGTYRVRICAAWQRTAPGIVRAKQRFWRSHGAGRLWSLTIQSGEIFPNSPGIQQRLKGDQTLRTSLYSPYHSLKPRNGRPKLMYQDVSYASQNKNTTFFKGRQQNSRPQQYSIHHVKYNLFVMQENVTHNQEKSYQ